MSPKVMAIISSSDREVIWTALLYARYAIISDWMGSIKVIIWGPSSRTIAGDDELQDNVREIIEKGEKVYVCKSCSDKYMVSDKLAELGCDIDYVGSISSKFIEDGYTIFNW